MAIPTHIVIDAGRTQIAPSELPYSCSDLEILFVLLVCFFFKYCRDNVCGAHSCTRMFFV